MAVAMRIISASAALLRLPISRTNSICVRRCAKFSSSIGWHSGAVANRGIVVGGGLRVKIGTESLSGEGSGGVEDNAALWLRQKLRLELEKDGVDFDRSTRIAEACADACSKFLATGRVFDPMMIMDVMEEEIERRGLRGDDFLPFELGRKAAKVVTQRWNELPVLERPETYRQEAYVNKKDVVDFDKWPKNVNFP